MSDTHAAQPAGAVRPAQHVADPQPRITGWTGWIVFGATMMIVLGAFEMIMGLVGVFQDGYYKVPTSQLVVHVDYTTWGWIHFGIGLVVLGVGIGLMAGQMWARVLGIIVAVVSAIVNLAFIGAYPVWGVIVIALDVLVIYAIAVHGREMKYASAP
jgi:hypothetical protein